MIERTEEFHQAAYFLSRFGTVVNGKQYPPKQLLTNKWDQAYDCFYDKLAMDRTVISFRRSLKSARDAFDSHIDESIREGWKIKNSDDPNPLGLIAKSVYDDFESYNQNQVWETIKGFVNISSKDYIKEINNVVTLQSDQEEIKLEGGRKVKVVSIIERSPVLRERAIKIHGTNCMACGFSFEKKYGVWGKGFIEVHHVVPLTKRTKPKSTDPKNDLIVLCSNCHRMIHRRAGKSLTLHELKSKITE